ncbi:MAG: hypothetical protein L3K26_05900 [Candidatus Hydrogenedentes bacterium]|nr:hypothetical protein [Candidatus Hydrogenedentota bacterium]
MLGLVFSVFASSIAVATNLDALIQDLGGNDESRRVTARQMLPHKGIDAVPPLLKLMENEDPVVWRTAKNVLADIGHGVGTLGFEKERREFTDRLMAVLRSDAPDWTIKHTIRLLGILVPEGYSLKPLRKLALDSKWRAETLGILEVMGTTESRKLLEKLSRTGSVEDRVEVIELLRLISAPVSPKLLKDSEPEIRVAAMRTLARRGTPDLIAPFEHAMNGLDGALRVEAMDAYLNLGETLAKNKKNRKEGLALFPHVLATETSVSSRGAALAGLGNFGDESVVPVIIKATQGKQGRDLEAPALMALGNLRGDAEYAAMLKVYPAVSEDMRLGLLGVFGRTQDPMFRKLLESATKSENASTLAAAKQALKQFNLPPDINVAEASHPPKKDRSAE